MRRALGVLLLLPALLSGTELKPWFDTDYLPVWRNSYAFEDYDRIDTGEGKVAIDGRNHLFDSSMSLTLDDSYAGEFEILASATSSRDFSFESGKFTGRMQLADDVIGDPLSIVAGLSLITPTRQARNDVNLLYHGLFECEVHVSFGREHAPMAHWESRWWSTFIVGLANRGSPWLSARIAWERQFCYNQRLELFVDGFGGCGHHDLVLSRPFMGYGGIAYRGIDLGLVYRYLTPCYGVFSLGYRWRPYARNLPLCVQQGLVQWDYEIKL